MYHAFITDLFHGIGYQDSVLSAGKRLLVTMLITVQQDATIYILLYFCKLLYMFRVVTPPIIRSTYNSNYSI